MPRAWLRDNVSDHLKQITLLEFFIMKRFTVCLNNETQLRIIKQKRSEGTTCFKIEGSAVVGVSMAGPPLRAGVGA